MIKSQLNNRQTCSLLSWTNYETYFNRNDFYLILMSVPLIRIAILVGASQLIQYYGEALKNLILPYWQMKESYSFKFIFINLFTLNLYGRYMYAIHVPNNDFVCLESLKYFYQLSKYLFRFRFRLIFMYRSARGLVRILVIIFNCGFIFLNDFLKYFNLI